MEQTPLLSTCITKITGQATFSSSPLPRPPCGGSSGTSFLKLCRKDPRSERVRRRWTSVGHVVRRTGVTNNPHSAGPPPSPPPGRRRQHQRRLTARPRRWEVGAGTKYKFAFVDRLLATLAGLYAATHLPGCRGQYSRSAERFTSQFPLLAPQRQELKSQKTVGIFRRPEIEPIAGWPFPIFQT